LNGIGVSSPLKGSFPLTDFTAPAPAPALSSPLRARGFAGLALASLAAYFALNVLTQGRSLNGSPITLWSPDNALSVMLIMESWAFTPVVLLAQIVTDFAVAHVQYSKPAVICAETTLAAGYLGMAIALRRWFGLDIRNMRPRDLIAVMAVSPIGAALTGLLYCGALVGVGAMAPGDFLSAFAGFWIGDSAAMGIVIPAMGALLRVAAAKPWRGLKSPDSLVHLAVTLIFLMFVIAFSASNIQHRYLFNLAYLPMLLIGLRFGYDTAAIVLLFVQLFLVGALDWFHVIDRRFDGYQVMMFILAVSGQALGAVATEWEAARTKLRSQQIELAKVSERASNGAMAAAMAHEISQPLASIATYVHSARRVLESGQSVEIALGALRKAEGEATRARLIIERLRDFVATGDMTRESVDLDDLLETILQLEEDAARGRGVTLRRVGPRSPSLQVNADRVGVEQAFANLVLNAIEAAPSSGGRVAVSLGARDRFAVLAVEDNGPGVDPEIADRLFEPFETTKPRGMGLGLPLAKEIAARHGGRLRWLPVIPAGARFELELPLA
jgi:two-component system, LuxR family, sensor kinase FixL